MVRDRGVWYAVCGVVNSQFSILNFQLLMGCVILNVMKDPFNYFANPFVLI